MLGQGRPDLSAMNIQAVMQMLPHRHPFLLVDRVVSCTPGKEIQGYKNVTRDESFLGLAPTSSQCGMPHMLILEAMAQIAVILSYKTLALGEGANPLFFFAGIDNARFSGEVRAGDQLQLGSSVVRIMVSRGIGKFATWAAVDGKRIAEATMIAATKTPTA